MAGDDQSDSESQESGSNSSSEELETPRAGGTKKIPQYEKERMKRIEENRARMEALGLPKMASAIMRLVPEKKKRREPKGKAKMVENDEDYRPPEEAECPSSSSEEDDDDEEEFVGGRKSSGIRVKKVKRKSSNSKKKKAPAKAILNNTDFIDDDEALMQAIALSLKDSSKPSDAAHGGPSQHPSLLAVDSVLNERKRNANVQEDTGKMKRKKSFTSRVQMTEDELVIHFFQFDVAGKGSITHRDIRKLAAAHDFPWTDEEIADMIYCFDGDGDEKLSLDDFRKIVARCNMIQNSEHASVSKS